MIMHTERDETQSARLVAVPTIRLGVMACLFALFAGHLQAAPGKLAQEPLFLASKVQSNIFFLLDDSGSMDEEVLGRNDGAGGYLVFSADDDSMKNLCVGYNVLAYDPTTLTDPQKKPYTPWFGLDSDGNAFADSDPNEARVNPYAGGSSNTVCDVAGVVSNINGTTCNLVSGLNWGQGGLYYAWADEDEDGEYDEGECDFENPVYVSDMTPVQQVNYANWFTYYRKREYIMKRAVSEIIAASTQRMGFATINRNAHVTKDANVGTQVKDIDDLTTPIDATAAANKKSLLDNLLGVDSSGWTPLRVGLEHTGQYFMGQEAGSTSLFGYTPVEDPESASGSSPILNTKLGGTCQQNFAIVMSDGYWNQLDPSVGNADGDSDRSPFDGQSYGDEVSNTLADIAMYFYETDLMGIDNDVAPVRIDVAPGDKAECENVLAENAHLHPNCFDTNTAQHLVTYTVAFGVRGSIPESDAEGEPCVPTSRDDTLASLNWPTTCDASLEAGWPMPIADSDTTVDDMMHAAWNGRGQFLSAKDPAELIDSLRNAIADIDDKKPVSAAAAVAVDASSILSGANVVKAKFDPSKWAGELYSYPLSDNGDGEAQNWAAHSELDKRVYTDRVAVTFNGNKGIPFRFPADYTNSDNLGVTEISQAQLNDLMFGAPYPVTTQDAEQIAANQDYGEKLVAYLLGDPTHEGTRIGKLRDRNKHKLGDIIHSAPVYVGDPDPYRYYDASYQAWANNSFLDSESSGAKGRIGVIYVGANDGGLHAFQATGEDAGKELFVYFPKAVFSDEAHWGLHYLADRDYAHRYYVDGEIAVAEAQINSQWRTILIGTLRGGGRSIFAIDISEPSNFTSAATFAHNIWEFSEPDLGFTYSKPVIAKLNNGRWGAIFGNGYNQGSGGTGEAVLFIKYLDNDEYVKISTDVGDSQAGDCLNAGSNCNGLSTATAVDLGADNIVDRVYAGDLMGNLWVFDISDSDPEKWGLAYENAPLIKAKDKNGVSQPITSKPSVVLHPIERSGNTSPNTMIFFGTGQYITENDPKSTAENTFYGVWDSGTAITDSRETALLKQTVINGKLGQVEVRTIADNDQDRANRRGWFVDLPDAGERVISRPFIAGDIVVYNTIIPEPSLCSSSPGSSWLMAHSLIDGSEPGYIAMDVNGDGEFDAKDQIEGENIAGKHSESFGSPITPVDTGDGKFLPVSSSDTNEHSMQTKPFKNHRSSWGRHMME